MIWVFPIHSTSVKKITESSVIFLRNGVLILNGKENKETTAICFGIRIPKKKNKKLLRKVPSKIYGSNFILEKNKNKFWFVYISEYHVRAMGLISINFECFLNHFWINFGIHFWTHFWVDFGPFFDHFLNDFETFF